MENEILSAEGFLEFECECGEPLGEDEENMIDACHEPFNGIIVTCPECNKEYSVRVGFSINSI